jgi:hypothetical protein
MKMPIHIYPAKLYTYYSPEIKELVAELSLSEEYKLEIHEDNEYKYIKLVKDSKHTVSFVFLKAGEREILHFIEITALYENEYKNTVERIKRRLRIFSVGWV